MNIPLRSPQCCPGCWALGSALLPRSQKPCLALPLVTRAPQLLTRGSIPGTGTNPVRSWKWISGLRSSWLLKWWTTTLFPSPRTCGVLVSSPTCCEWLGQGRVVALRALQGRNAAATEPLWLWLLLINSVKAPSFSYRGTSLCVRSV